MGFVSMLTGRNNLYADEDKINKVIEELEVIKNKELENIKEEIAAEIKNLNNCTGFTEYVSADIHPHTFDPVIEAGQESIQSLIGVINGKVDDIKAYSESSLGDKIFSTYLMTNFKTMEGFLSVFEGIGDGVVSVVGWVAPKDSGVENWCSKFVEKNYSHDAFNFYYNSSLAKASMVTEDSGIAKVCKFAGEAAGYYVTGSAFMKAFGTASKLGKASSIFQKMQKAGVIEGTLYGMGNTTQSALQQGASMDAAAAAGLKQGAIDGTIAMVIPVGLEKMSNSGFVSKAKNIFNNAKNKFLLKKGKDSIGKTVSKTITFEDQLIKEGIKSGDAIPANILKENNIRLRKGETLHYNQKSKEFYRIDIDGKKHLIASELFESNALRNKNMRLVLDEKEGMLVDQITGGKTPKKPLLSSDGSITWRDSHAREHIITGTAKGKAAGLHYIDSFIDRANKGEIFLYKDGKYYIKSGYKINNYPDAVEISSISKNADGSLSVLKADSTSFKYEPNSEGLVSVQWGNTTGPKTLKNPPGSTFCPFDWDESDIKTAVETFIQDETKSPLRVQIADTMNNGVYVDNAEYRFVYTNPKTGNPITMGVQVNGSSVHSIYPIDIDQISNSVRPNTYH